MKSREKAAEIAVFTLKYVSTHITVTQHVAMPHLAGKQNQ